MRAALSFVLGFTLVFAVMGVAFSGGAKMLQSAGLTRILDIVGGVLVMLLGVNLIFDFIGFLRVDKRAIARFSGKKISGDLEALLLGMSFAVGWSPCIGPLLASILFMAGQSGSTLQAFVLLLFYSGALEFRSFSLDCSLKGQNRSSTFSITRHCNSNNLWSDIARRGCKHGFWQARQLSCQGCSARLSALEVPGEEPCPGLLDRSWNSRASTAFCLAIALIETQAKVY